MHATTSSCITAAAAAAIDAGRQALVLPTTQNTSLVQSPKDAPVISQSPVQKPSRERSVSGPKTNKATDERRRSSTLEKVTWLVDLIIPIFRKPRIVVDKWSPTNSGSATNGQDWKGLKDAHKAACLVALQEENDKARLALKDSIMPYCTPEQFDKTFPPSLQYISKVLADEISDRVWEELVSASGRK